MVDVCPDGVWIAHDTRVLGQFAEWDQIETTHGLGVFRAARP